MTSSRTSGPVLRVEQVECVERLEDYREAWQGLQQRASGGDPFTSYEWLTAWLHAFWEGKSLAFLFVWRQERLVGLVPLVWDAEGDLWCPGSFVLPVNLQTTREDILCEGDPVEVMEAALAHLRSSGRPVRLALKHVRTDGVALQSLPRVLTDQGMATVVQVEPDSPIVGLEGDWESYLRARSRRCRSEMRRKRKAAERSGQVGWRVVSDPEGVAGAVGAVLEIERHSWKEGAGTSLTREAGVDRFFAELATLCARTGSLRVYLLELDAQPIAYAFCILHGDELYALKTSYRSDFGQLSPGVVLFGYVLQDAFAQGYALVDLLGETSRWKREIATTCREHRSVCVFSSHLPRCQLCRLVEHRVRPFVRGNAPRLLESKQRLSNWLAARRRKSS